MLDVFFSTSSILHLCMISFDRYMALARPFQHRNTRSTFSSSRIGALNSQNKPQTIKRAARRVILVWATAFGKTKNLNHNHMSSYTDELLIFLLDLICDLMI